MMRLLTFLLCSWILVWPLLALMGLMDWGRAFGASAFSTMFSALVMALALRNAKSASKEGSR